MVRVAFEKNGLFLSLDPRGRARMWELGGPEFYRIFAFALEKHNFPEVVFYGVFRDLLNDGKIVYYFALHLPSQRAGGRGAIILSYMSLQDK